MNAQAMKAKVLTLPNASTVPAVVKVATLTVDSRQITLAMFRQLPVARGIKLPALSLWGIVRYPIKGEGNVWAVGTADGVLHRVCIDREPASGSAAERVRREHHPDWTAWNETGVMLKLGKEAFEDVVRYKTKELDDCLADAAAVAAAYERGLDSLPQLFIAR